MQHHTVDPAGLAATCWGGLLGRQLYCRPATAKQGWQYNCHPNVRILRITMQHDWTGRLGSP